jgi:ubiquinone/menaquinone biosynthesis C-methylase UbiE
MKLFYRANYFEEFGKKYDSISEGDFMLLKSLLPPLRPGSRILELGCGSCAFGRRVQLLVPNSSLVGLDNCLPLMKWSSTSCCQGDASFLPFRDKSFDCILVAAAFHHFPNIVQTLTESFRCLQSGGILFSYEPNMFHPQRLICMTDPLRAVFYKTGDHAISPIWMRSTMEQLGFRNLALEFIALGEGSSSSVARYHVKFTNFIKARLPRFAPFTAPWFAITGTKE